MVRVTTWPAWRIRYSSRRNSRGCSGIASPARVTPGEHAVDDEHVIGVGRRQRQALFAVGGVLGDVAGLAQSLQEILRGFPVVLDDQDAHGAHNMREREE